MNRLVGKKITRISTTPGATKYFQTYFPENSKNIQLIDCPGLIFPAYGISYSEQILAGSYPISQVQEPYTTIAELMKFSRIFLEMKLDKLSKNLLNTELAAGDNCQNKFLASHKNPENYYNFDQISPIQILQIYSEIKGFYTGKGGGNFDIYKSANQILRQVVAGEWNVYSDFGNFFVSSDCVSSVFVESTGGSSTEKNEKLANFMTQDQELIKFLENLLAQSQIAENTEDWWNLRDGTN